jgi:hypothetical protein
MSPQKLLSHEVSYPATVLMNSTKLKLVVVERMCEVTGSCINLWPLAHQQVSHPIPHFSVPRNFDRLEDYFHLHGIAFCIVVRQLVRACANLKGPTENVDSPHQGRVPVLVVLDLLAPEG